ncbi:hypothetical protein [Glaciihabitans sp. UYNi722]
MQTVVHQQWLATGFLVVSTVVVILGFVLLTAPRLLFPRRPMAA